MKNTNVAAGFSLRKNKKQNVAIPFKGRKIKNPAAADSVAAPFKVRNKKIIEKKHRLPIEFYRWKINVFFTLCVKNSKKVFIRDEIVEKFVDILKNCAFSNGCIVPVYCFMPDHLHVIISGIREDSEIRNCIIKFKQRTGYYFSQNFKNVKWQKDFYDHIIRKSEVLSNIVRYILQNPVRKGIVEKWKDYPFSGSIGIKLEDVLNGIYD